MGFDDLILMVLGQKGTARFSFLLEDGRVGRLKVPVELLNISQEELTLEMKQMLYQNIGPVKKIKMTGWHEGVHLPIDKTKLLKVS